jgi:hypothetical protein
MPNFLKYMNMRCWLVAEFLLFLLFIIFFLYNRYQIIKYTDSWAYTGDLADSIYARGELSNHCMEDGIEYLRRTNKVEGKYIMSYQVSSYLMTGNFVKPVLVSNFKRRSDFSLSVMKQVSFF